MWFWWISPSLRKVHAIVIQTKSSVPIVKKVALDEEYFIKYFTWKITGKGSYTFSNTMIWENSSIIININRNFIMLNTMIENEIKVLTDISVFLLRSWLYDHEILFIFSWFVFKIEIKILVQLLLSFSVFVFDMMKLLAILKVKGTLMQIWKSPYMFLFI